MSNFVEKISFTLELNKGLNDYLIASTVLNKGSLIMVDQTIAGKIGAVEADILSDFVIQSSKAFDSEFSLAISPIFSQQKNESFHFFSKNYSNPGIYSISIMNGDLNMTKKVQISLEQNLESVCQSFAFREINCNFMHMSMISTHIFYYLNTETNHTVNLKGNKTNLLGSSFSDNIFNYTGDRNQFLLTSSEFMFGFNLRGFDVYAVQEGDVTIQLINLTFCGQNSCLDHFMTNSSILSMVVSQSWKINLNKGLNRIYLSEIIPVGKGQILSLIQNGTGRIGLDENSVFPDFSISHLNGNYFLKQIDRTKFSRFCLNPIIDRFMYKYEIYFRKKFLSSGEKDIKFGVENFISNEKKINIKDLDSIDIICMNGTIDMSINCSILVLSNDWNRKFQLLINDQITHEFNISSI